MPESPLSPTAARQTPASSLLSHTDNGAGERAANGDSCSGVSAENWQSLHHKQVSSFTSSSILGSISGKKNSLSQTHVKGNTASRLHIGHPLTGHQTWSLGLC